MSEKRGVVTMPTGAGKTILAVMLIAKIGRPTLIHVPTIDLMRQWKEVLAEYFDTPIGLFGGGYNEIQKITVATYMLKDKEGIKINYLLPKIRKHKSQSMQLLNYTERGKLLRLNFERE